MACTNWLSCKVLPLNWLVPKPTSSKNSITTTIDWSTDQYPAPLTTGGQAVGNVFCELVGDNVFEQVITGLTLMSAAM